VVPKLGEGLTKKSKSKSRNLSHKTIKRTEGEGGGRMRGGGGKVGRVEGGRREELRKGEEGGEERGGVVGRGGWGDGVGGGGGGGGRSGRYSLLNPGELQNESKLSRDQKALISQEYWWYQIIRGGDSTITETLKSARAVKLHLVGPGQMRRFSSRRDLDVAKKTKPQRQKKGKLEISMPFCEKRHPRRCRHHVSRNER